MASRPSRESFIAVRLDSSGLPKDTVEQINRALQKTLVSQLAELALVSSGRVELGLPTDDRFKDLFGGNGGRTDGIVARIPDLRRL